MGYQRGKHTRGINVNSGMDAFERAYGITKGVMADFAKSKAEGEIKTLGADASAVQGTGLKVGGDEGVVTGQGVDENGNAISGEDAYRQAYARAGMDAPEIETTGTKYAARAGEGKDYGVYDSELAAEAGSRKANHGLLRKKADIYQKNGMTEEATGLRREARVGERQDSQDAMALESHNQSMKLGTFQVSEAERRANKQAALDTSVGEAMTIEDTEQRRDALLKAYFAFDPKVAAELAQTYTKQQLNDIALRAAQLGEKRTEAFSKGPEGAVAWYDEIKDGFSAKLVPGAKGNFSVLLYDENNPDAPPRTLIQNSSRDNIVVKIDAMTKPGGILDLAEREQRLKLISAQTNAANANTAESYAGVGLKGAQADAARTDRDLPKLTKLAVERLDKDLDRLNTQYTAAMNSGDKTAQATIATAMASKAAERDRLMLPQGQTPWATGGIGEDEVTPKSTPGNSGAVPPPKGRGLGPTPARTAPRKPNDIEQIKSEGTQRLRSVEAAIQAIGTQINQSGDPAVAQRLMPQLTQLQQEAKKLRGGVGY